MACDSAMVTTFEDDDLLNPDATDDPATTADERPRCLRCDVPIYYDNRTAEWLRESTGSYYCPRNPERDGGHEPIVVTASGEVTYPDSAPEDERCTCGDFAGTSVHYVDCPIHGQSAPEDEWPFGDPDPVQGSWWHTQSGRAVHDAHTREQAVKEITDVVEDFCDRHAPIQNGDAYGNLHDLLVEVRRAAIWAAE